MGETNTAASPPRLTAPENIPTDQPMDWVIGTTNTESVATAITVRVDRLSATPVPRDHPPIVERQRHGPSESAKR